MITLTLPYPPSVNAAYGSHGNRRFMRPRAVIFKKAVAELCKGLPSFGDRPVELSIIFHPRDKRLMDISNSIKILEDSLQGYLYDDDQQVWKLTIERAEKIKGGGCVVTVKEYCKHE